ncbi:MAG: deoxyguanosinetriphosphate triphosphohydrolase [Lachnospiraceae bacterium]|nr:deoxyguanosinetriphosphate triphosphohydrolase [Lachnospiraceae bacterium]
MNWEELLCADRIRSFHKTGSTDLRSEYEKDLHRIIVSASFRRLQDKTQVFPLDKSDFVRTRLTHSLEVSSVSKSLAQNIGRSITRNIKDPTFKPENQADICDILQCAGLLHDIGNPPFGHFGETIIRSFFEKNLSTITYRVEGTEHALPLSELLTPQMQNDFTHFEGNAQALRLTTKLHYLVDEHGMNLTKALLATIIKYPVSSLEINRHGAIREHKMGYFYADREVFDNIETSTGLYGARHPLTFLLEAGDDIAYHTADIEDAFKKGFINYDQLLQELEDDADPVIDAKQNDRFRQSQYRQLIENLKYRYSKAIERGMKDPATYAVQNWVIAAQGALIAAATDGFTKNYEAIMAGTYGEELFAGTGGQHINDRLGEIAMNYVFESRSIKTIEISAERILSYLLDCFVHAVLDYDVEGRTLTPINRRLMILVSDNYKEIYHIYSKDKDPVEKLYLRLLLITDFVCGMTDSYAQDLYWKLNGRIS